MRRSFVFVWMTGMLLATSAAEATPFGDFAGTQVTYRSVSDLNGLLRSPEVVGDALAFDPVDFELTCPGPGACDAAPLQLIEGSVFEVVANPGSSLRSLTITLVGEGMLEGVSGERTAISAFARAFVTIREVEGVVREIGSVGNDDASYEFSSLESGTTTAPWSLSLTVDLDEIIAGENFGRLPHQQITGHATRVALDLAFALGVVAPPGSSARIALADVDGIVVTAVVPEPTSACLTTLGLLALACTRRRP